MLQVTDKLYYINLYCVHLVAIRNQTTNLHVCADYVGGLTFMAFLGKPEYQEKTTDQPRISDKLYHIMFKCCIKYMYAMSWMELEVSNSR
jgi:hypothetical protein